ncbi:MAG TPA: GDYXXLXY domain-containing protein, partial [Chryseolinea sp.]|nr:GDYXXLXY domain-containing protein [Chryseolinea sp.]
MKNIIMILFAVMCLAQWIVPGKMVYDSENTISLGTVFKFKTEPVDPSDPFRGKYVTLRFESDFIEIEDSAEWVSGEDIFVTFTTDMAGFAKAENIFR